MNSITAIHATSRSAEAPETGFTLRLALADEAHVVRRLAELDDARTPEGPVLLGLAEGEAVAALSLSDGRVVANPFLETREVAALLRLRARQLSPPAPRRRWRAVLRPWSAAPAVDPSYPG